MLLPLVFVWFVYAHEPGRGCIPAPGAFLSTCQATVHSEGLRGAGGTRREARRVWKDALTGHRLFRVWEERRICNKDMHSSAIYNPKLEATQITPNWDWPGRYAEEGMEMPGHVTRGEAELRGDKSLVRGGSQI